MTLTLRCSKTQQTYLIEKGRPFSELAKKFEKQTNRKVYGVKFNNNIKELFKPVEENGEIEFLDLSTPDGVRIYQRGLLFILFLALKDIDPSEHYSVHYSVGNGLYCEFKNSEASEEKLNALKNTMLQIISQDIKFEKLSIDKYKAMSLFSEQGLHSKALLVKFRKKSTVNVYRAKGYYNYFYGYMPVSSAMIDKFDLQKFNGGFMLLHPNETCPDAVPQYKHFEKLSNTFSEYKNWLKIMEIETVGELNEIILKGKEHSIELIRVAEALHEKKYAMIADEIIKSQKARLILIAGPSSSGKTTSAKRLSLQLKVNGLKPVSISLDDYFVERSQTPRDENGNYDFESINALDLELFNKNLVDLLNGNAIELPKFDFISGTRKPSGKVLKIAKDQPVIIEGIHGLNEQLTNRIPRENKFKIYVSALTQMSLDDVNRIPTTDTRIIRRIVRDFNTRGHSALSTLKMWPSVRRGEEKNIFPFQEDADVMFNSHLAYELAVLKLFAEPLLLQIEPSCPEFSEAKRLLRFLDYYLPVTELEEIPRHSVIREFIGRSTFEY